MNRLIALALASLCACANEHAPTPAPTVTASGSGSATAAPTAKVTTKPAPTYATAMAAYDKKDYASCATQFDALATTVTAAHRKRDMMYSAACCQAMGKQLDQAFATLDAAVAIGFTDVAQVDKDTDLANLRGDPRWQPFHYRIVAKQVAIENALTKPALRKELLAMVDKDQEALMARVKANKDGDHARADALMPKIDEVVKQHTARLRAIVERDGWPAHSMVGEDGAHAAWLLVQHADKDLALQKQALALMKPLVDQDEVGKVDYAYLEDRIAVAEKRPQRYGTQFGPDREPQPIEDEAHVDERRTAIGMSTMAEYRAQMTQMYGPPPAK